MRGSRGKESDRREPRRRRDRSYSDRLDADMGEQWCQSVMSGDVSERMADLHQGQPQAT